MSHGTKLVTIPANDTQLFEALARTMPGLVWVCDDNGRVEFNTPRWTEFTGLPQPRGLGFGWLDVVPPADAAAIRARMPLSGSRQSSIQDEVRLRRHDGVYHRHSLNLSQLGNGKWVACALDAQEWLAAKLRDTTQGKVLELVSAGAELDAVLTELCLAAQKHLRGAVCSVLLVDAARRRIIEGIAPDLPDDLLESLSRVKIGSGVGSCGTAAFEKRDIISADIASDPLWDGWRDPFVALGFCACWSVPVFASDGAVIACLGFYFRRAREPAPAEWQEMNRLRGLASVAIERSRILEALRESEEHYRHAVEQNPQIPWTADPTGELLSVSSRWQEATGFSPDSALGNGWLQALHPDDVAATIEGWEEALSTGGPMDINYRIRRRDGAYRWVRARATARRGSDGSILRWYGTVEDIHQQYLANKRLRRYAYHDDLTGLPNRRRFVEELRRRLDTAREPIGLLVLDLDDFKMVNDRFGHQTGNAVLRLFGWHLQRAVRTQDFVARLGGDEFAMICGDIRNDRDLLARATSIEAKLDGRLKASRKARGCKPSVGCALGHAGENPDEVFMRADLALHAAKASGKSAVRLFDPAIRSAVARRSEELDLARTALREGWIVAFYQPIVRLPSQETCGFEALLRICHPDRGIIAPMAIKAAFDDPRLANAIGERMAQLVVGDLSAWAAAGIAFGQVSINLATENLVEADFVDTLLGLLDEKGLSRQSVKLEITERVLMDELGADIRDNLDRLRDMGIRISLDDFGTGYASLIHLQMLPVDEIKIDRTFVSGLGGPGNGGEIVRAMIGLAQTLGLRTVAEGIESEVEANLLSSWGCECGQGYLFGRPMPAEAVARRLEATAPTDPVLTGQAAEPRLPPQA